VRTRIGFTKVLKHRSPLYLREMIRDKIASGRVTLGSWISIGHPSIAEIMAKAGFEWLVIDLEHTAISIDQAAELIRTIDLCGISPLVRLTSNDPNLVKRVMDQGAHGIIVPMVNSPAEAAKAVAATRYGPRGMRGVGLGRAQGYGATFDDYLAWQEDGPVVIVQIEHLSAVDPLAEILAVPGVDGLIIGPYDLSCSMGMPGRFKRPEFESCVARILDTGKRSGKAVGLHIVEPDLAQLDDAVRNGYTFIAYSVDMRMLDVASRAGVARLERTGK